MDIKTLQTIVVNALEDVKAQDIKLYDTTQLTSLFDRVCIASGTSNRQTKALAQAVREKVKDKGGVVISVEGEDLGEWVLVDLGDMVVHIMQPVIRGYYRLEELWGEKEIKSSAAKRVKTTSLSTTQKQLATTTASSLPLRKHVRQSKASETIQEEKNKTKKINSTKTSGSSVLSKPRKKTI